MLTNNADSGASVQALQTLTLDRFLPLTRMKELSASAHSAYLNAAPYPHVVWDDFFDASLVDSVLAEFPKADAIRWQKFDNEHEIKLASARASPPSNSGGCTVC